MYTSPVDASGEPTEAPWDAIKAWLAGNGAATDPHAIGRRRQPANPGPNDWDVTVKWINAITYEGVLRTARANIHFLPGQIAGYQLGSIWIQGIGGVDVNLNEPGVARAAIDNIAHPIVQNNGVGAIALGNANW